jgi:hypothetical protein
LGLILFQHKVVLVYLENLLKQGSTLDSNSKFDHLGFPRRLKREKMRFEYILDFQEENHVQIVDSMGSS